MNILTIASVPLLELTQKSYETQVVENVCKLQNTYNIEDRKSILKENQMLEELINHIRTILHENNTIRRTGSRTRIPGFKTRG